MTSVSDLTNKLQRTLDSLYSYEKKLHQIIDFNMGPETIKPSDLLKVGISGLYLDN
jgi:hypothetical protein